MNLLQKSFRYFFKKYIPHSNFLFDKEEISQLTNYQISCSLGKHSKFNKRYQLVHPDEIKRNVEYDVFLQDACYGKVEYVSVMKHTKRYVKKY
jgi:hypothetical protein